MAKAKKTNWSRKKIIVILAIAALLVTLCGVLSLFYRQPDYSDLKRQYATLKIPTDWRIVSKEDRINSLWHSCPSFGDLECPLLTRGLHSDKAYTTNSAKTDILRIFSQAGYQGSENCNLLDPSVCYGEFTGVKSHIKLTIRYNNLTSGGADFGVTLESVK